MALSFNSCPEPMNYVTVALQELCKQVAQSVVDMEKERKDMMIEKKSLHHFTKYVSELSTLVQVLNVRGVEQSTESAATRKALQNLYLQLKEACKIIEKQKSGSRVRLLLSFSSFLAQMEQLAKQISETVTMLGVANHGTLDSIKSKTDEIAENLRSLEFRRASATEAIVLEIEKAMTQNIDTREHNRHLLQKILDAVGAKTSDALLWTEELELLEREKEEMEDKKQQSEALQLSQLIRLLSSTEGEDRTSSSVLNGNEDAQVLQQRTFTENSYDRQQDLISPFQCPLSRRIMDDPVAIACGHSFERGAIQDYFERGEKACPECRQLLSSLELTPNISLRNTIVEWRQRNMDMKFTQAISNISANEPDKVSQAMEDLVLLLEIPHYRDDVTIKGLVPKMVELLRSGNRINTKAVLKCLYFLASHSEENKRTIVEAGVIRYIRKQFCKGEAQPESIAVLVELSEEEEFAEEIGNTNDCIPFLVSLVQNYNPTISQKAEKVVDNLSSNTHFVIKMADAGYFQPFITHFNQGPMERKASMATALVQMQLSEERVKVFENEKFVGSLIQVLSSSSPAYRSACLQCIKKLSAYPMMCKWFLAKAGTVPALLSQISYVSSDLHWRQTSTEILTSLIESVELSDFTSNSNLQELQSEYNIGVFLQFVSCATSDSQTKAQFLHMLLAIGHKSRVARELIWSDGDAVANLFSSLLGDQHLVIQWSLKLIYCISEDYPTGIPLPPSPVKESAIRALVAIFTSSSDVENRSLAAAIMSRLPIEDATVDEIICRSETLKAMGQMICAMDSGDLDFVTEQERSLLENALAALVQYTNTNKPELRKQLGELEFYPSLVRILSSGSSGAKKWAATALARLSQPSVPDLAPMEADNGPLKWLARLLTSSSWCCSSFSPAASASHSRGRACPVHGFACSSKDAFCLVKANAVRPLVQALNEADAAEAALLALDTLLKEQSTLSQGASAIAECEGVLAILNVLERGLLTAKDKALDLFQKILPNIDISQQILCRSQKILLQLLNDDALKKKAASLLSEMDFIKKQSSFF